MLKVLLVNPVTTAHRTVGPMIDPYGLMMVASAIRNICELTVLDFNVLGLTNKETLEEIDRIGPDVIAIPGWMDNYSFIEWLTREVHQRGPQIRQIIGGPLATVAPEVYLEHLPVDFVVIGESQVTLVELIQRLEAGEAEQTPGLAFRRDGKIEFSPARKPIQNLGDFLLPARGLFPMEKYLQVYLRHYPGKRWATVITSFGCAYACNFCGANYLGPLRFRRLSDVEEELRILRQDYGIEIVFFGDATLTLDRERTIELCQITQSLGIEWFCETRIDHLDPELLKTMADSGCQEVYPGIESLSKPILKSIGKRTTTRQNIEAIEMIRGVGIRVVAHVLLGMPDETEKSLEKLVKFAEQSQLLTNPSLLRPIPGTILWRELAAQGRAPKLPEYLYSIERYNRSGRLTPAINLTNLPDEVLTQAIARLLANNERIERELFGSPPNY